MPDPIPSHPWLALGRLLPATLRERVFEPAYFDLLASRRGARVPFGLQVFGLVLETCRVGWPAVLLGLWRAPGVRWALVVVGGLVASVFAFASYAYQWRPHARRGAIDIMCS
jgi:hypothetical protein